MTSLQRHRDFTGCAPLVQQQWDAISVAQFSHFRGTVLPLPAQSSATAVAQFCHFRRTVL
ncbi:MAG: hypothetical protein IJT97_03290 [Bacteroidaceae bacterium]|nr:hypothetical protein [Bacteroidaceae bacterium]